MNQTLKKKISSLFTPLLYLATAISICIASASLMKNSFYSYVFVSGGSMNPTLKGGSDSGAIKPHLDGSGKYVAGETVHFGVTDDSDRAKKNIERYDIVTTYYPWSDYDSSGSVKDGAEYKIKRVIALPNETFKIENGNLYVKNSGEFTLIPQTYETQYDSNPVTYKDVSERTLGKNEYWVMGDHRGNSSDCVNANRPVTYKNIIGVLVCIQGEAEYFVHYRCKKCHAEIDEMDYLNGTQTSCPNNCGGIIEQIGDIRHKHYTYPGIV
ncbi:MAG: signal peptidase I [Bacilli bacterium]|nr:signal peptidase I [Bacilli bacterium]